MLVRANYGALVIREVCMRYEENDDWPRHPDGSRKRLGEMSPAEQHRQFIAFARRLDRDLMLVREREHLAEQGIRVNH